MAEQLNSVEQRLRYPLSIDSGSGRLTQEPDYAAYMDQLIRQVLLTGQGERINRPTFGAGVRRLVFAPNSPGTASLAETAIYQSLTTWLGEYIKIEQVSASAVEERLEITIAYLIRIRGERRFLNLEVTI